MEVDRPLFYEEVLLALNETKQWTDKRYGGFDRRWLLCILGEVKQRRKENISRSQTSKAHRECRGHFAVPKMLPELALTGQINDARVKYETSWLSCIRIMD